MLPNGGGFVTTEPEMHWTDPRQIQFARNMAIAATRRGEEMMAINVRFLLAVLVAADAFVRSSAPDVSGDAC